MSHILQNYLADSAIKGAADLETALMRLPEDKRNWKPEGTSRSALDQVAEVAILAGVSALVIDEKKFPEHFDFERYSHDKEELAADWPRLKPLLDKNIEVVASAIRAVDFDALDTPVQMPWGEMTLQQIIGYPYWNASYHEGQINYIASLLGCLD